MILNEFLQTFFEIDFKCNYYKHVFIMWYVTCLNVINHIALLMVKLDNFLANSPSTLFKFLW